MIDGKESERRPRMLIVEDEPDMAVLLKRVLNRTFDAQVTIAEDCASARETLASETYKVITLDYRLPDGDGLELLEEIKAIENPPRVVMVTGQGDEQIAASAIRLGASGYVVKDKRLTTLLPDAVKHALSEIALKRAKDRLRDMVAKCQAISEVSREGVIFHEDGKILLANKRAGEVLGYDPDELVGMDGFQFIDSGDHNIARAHIESGGKNLQEATLVRRDRSTLTALIHSSATQYQGRPAEVIAAWDITKHKRVEEELKKIFAEVKSHAHSFSSDLKGALAGTLIAIEAVQELLFEMKGDMPES